MDFLTDPLWIVIAVFNAIVAFLILVNMYLPHGRMKVYRDAVLSACLIAIFATLLLVYGWVFAVVQLVSSMIFGAMTQGYAARLAARLLQKNMGPQ